MLRIFGVEESRAFRVYWMARELQIDFEKVPIHFFGDAIRSADYAAINPNSRIPAIDDDGLCLFESVAINLYLAKSRGGPLAPKDVAEDAKMIQWSIWAMTELERDLMTAMLNRRVFRREDRSEAEEQAAIRNLQRPLSVLNTVLKTSDWLVGERFTVADLNVAAVASLARLGEVPLDDTPHVDGWLARCLARKDCNWEIQRLPQNLPRPATIGP